MASSHVLEHVAHLLDEVDVRVISTPWEETGVLNADVLCPPSKEFLLRLIMLSVACTGIARGDPKWDAMPMALFCRFKEIRGGRFHTLSFGALPKRGLHLLACF